MKPNAISFSQEFLKSICGYDNGNLMRKHKIAGCIGKSGYRQIRVHGVIYPAHRLIWVYHHGSIDTSLQIDHMNGIKDDNRVENLRLVPAQINCFNRSRLTAKGYTWHKGVNKWQSSIFVDGKTKYLGLFSKQEDARNMYLRQCAIHHQGVTA